MASNFLPALIRTTVPVIVGWLLGLGVVRWTGLTEADLAAAVTPLITVGYYVAVRVFETYISPKFGWLLGFARLPIYGEEPADR